MKLIFKLAILLTYDQRGWVRLAPKPAQLQNVINICIMKVKHFVHWFMDFIHDFKRYWC